MVIWPTLQTSSPHLCSETSSYQSQGEQGIRGRREDEVQKADGIHDGCNTIFLPTLAGIHHFHQLGFKAQYSISHDKFFFSKK
jgi:hypothetical protein